MPCYELHKLLVFGTEVIADLVFFASHVPVPFNLAGEAVLFFALFALELDRVLRGEEEHVLAPGSGAP